jgi:hypothetical protein
MTQDQALKMMLENKRQQELKDKRREVLLIPSYVDGNIPDDIPVIQPF